jgi:hypothetical protein
MFNVESFLPGYVLFTLTKICMGAVVQVDLYGRKTMGRERRQYSRNERGKGDTSPRPL